MRALAFVPVASGSLRCASQLFHPRVAEAVELLDGAEVYPSGAFADAAVLSVLEQNISGSPVILSRLNFNDLVEGEVHAYRLVPAD